VANEQTLEVYLGQAFNTEGGALVLMIAIPINVQIKDTYLASDYMGDVH
jgi:hypothetical protein